MLATNLTRNSPFPCRLYRTNHLDAESIAWLETYLDKFQGTVVCITHDRYFLNNCAGWILELDRGKGYPHEGNYETFLEMKNKRLEEEKKQSTAAAKAVSNELEWIRSNPKAKGNKSKARLNRYDELLAAAAPTELRNAGQIYIPPGPRLGNEVVEVVNLKKSFGDRLLIDDLSFSLPPAGIVGVVGPNGTLQMLKLLSLFGRMHRRSCDDLYALLKITYFVHNCVFKTCDCRCWKIHTYQYANWKGAT